MKILAFTASKNRPVLLRHCLLQMQQQSIHIDHTIFVNHDEKTPQDYTDLLNDIQAKEGTQIFIDYSLSTNQHDHHIKSIKNVPWKNYDLFLKIDDDDIYLNDYTEAVLKDFKKNKWDFSGSITQGLLNGTHFDPHRHIQSLGQTTLDIKIGTIEMMPGSYAFSKKAIEFILNLPTHQGYEDPYWRQELTKANTFVIHKRNISRYIYNIHGKNISTHHLYKDTHTNSS